MNPLLDELLTEMRRLDPDMVFLTGDMIWGCIGEGLVSTDDIRPYCPLGCIGPEVVRED